MFHKIGCETLSQYLSSSSSYLWSILPVSSFLSASLCLTYIYLLIQDEKDAIRSLDLLYRRVETEILKREATPAMRLLNDLLSMHDGFDDEGWLKECKKRMIATFPREDPFSIIVPTGFDIDKHQGPLRPSLDSDEVLLRVDFVREVDELLREVRAEEAEVQNIQGLDPESVATRLKQQEKQRTIRQVESLLDLSINLQWY